MTERTIQDGLFQWISQKGYLLACPNYTPRKWWECDLFAVTKANRFVEFEIKVTKSDFKADQSKSKPEHFAYERGIGRKVVPASSKHERIEGACTDGPSRFFYVVPDGLIEPQQVPSWAGLLHVRKYGKLMRFHIAKAAPKIHNEPVDPRVVQHMASVFYWRYWKLRQGLKEDHPC